MRKVAFLGMTFPQYLIVFDIKIQVRKNSFDLSLTDDILIKMNSQIFLTWSCTRSIEFSNILCCKYFP